MVITFGKFKTLQKVLLLMSKESIADGLRDGSGEHGEGFVHWLLCRTCSEQPEQLLNKELMMTAPNLFR